MENKVYARDRIGLAQFIVDQQGTLKFIPTIKDNYLLRTGKGQEYRSQFTAFKGHIKPVISVISGNDIFQDIIQILIPETEIRIHMNYLEDRHTEVIFSYILKQEVLEVNLNLAEEAVKEEGFTKVCRIVNDFIKEKVHTFLKSVIDGKVADKNGEWKLKGKLVNLNFVICY